MAGMTVTILDLRIGKNLAKREQGDKNITVGPDDYYIQILETLAKEKEMIKSLNIFAHGLYFSGHHVDTFGRIFFDPPSPGLYGGYGVVLGKEFVTSSNVDGFKCLKGRFEPKGTITLHVCGASLISPDKAILDGKTVVRFLIGNGTEVCKRMATNTGATVYASPDMQEFTFNWTDRELKFGFDGFPSLPVHIVGDKTEVSFGSMQGTVQTFMP